MTNPETSSDRVKRPPDDDVIGVIRAARERFDQIDCQGWGGQNVPSMAAAFDLMKVFATDGSRLLSSVLGMIEASRDSAIDATTIERLTAERDAWKAKWIEADEDAKVQKEFLATADALNARQAEVLKPFSDFAGELFARNWNASQVVCALDNPGDPHQLTAGDFFQARVALTKGPSNG